MSKDIKRVELVTLAFVARAMVDMLNSAKPLEALKLCPGYVKDGKMYSFNDKYFGDTNQEDCDIIKRERVVNAQAVTSALKRDYGQAIENFFSAEPADGIEAIEAEVVDEPKKKKKKVKAEEVTPEFNLKDEIKNLVHLGKLKKAKKLIGDNENHPDFKKAKKILKKATKGDK